MASRPPCAWDQTEVVVKASVEPRDQPFATEWVQAYTTAMSCFPRLHVLADSLGDPVVRAPFERVPNVTLHELNYPAPMRAAGMGVPGRNQQQIHRLPPAYYSIQWPFLWADNWTVAAHIMVFDTDTLPLLPLRCHHLFDDSERPIWHTWEWRKSPGWTEPINAIVPPAGRSRRDFMTFFPIVIPRVILPTAREAVEKAHGAHFDDAWLRIKNPSYADLLGKVAQSSHPDLLRVVHCPALGRINEPIPAALLQSQFPCLGMVSITEHLKHPQRDCHTGTCHHQSRASALQYGRMLRREAARFVAGQRTVPWQLFHYQFNRSEAQLQSIGSQLLREDAPGRTCGAGQTGGLATDLTSKPVEPMPVPSWPSPSSEPTAVQSSSFDPNGAPVELLLYDNHYTPGRPFKKTDMLYRSATALGVPFQVGSLAPASQRAWRSGDREKWLLKTLPTMTAQLVVLLDASDAVLFCRTQELVRKWRKLVDGSSAEGQGRGRVVVGAEVQLWPEDASVDIPCPRSKLCGWPRAPNLRRRYPMPPMGSARTGDGKPKWRASGSPFRHINIGLMAGRPATLLALLQCMSQRYAGFPHQCPNQRFVNGSYDFVSNAPHRTRFGVLHGHWGWEQSCFHIYLHEHTMGLLPPQCPELVLDYGADYIINLVKSSPALALNWRSPQRPRINETLLPSLRGARPCVVHANSAMKSAMPVLQLYWERMHAAKCNASLPTERELCRALLAYQAVSPCIQVAPKVAPGAVNPVMKKPAVCPGSMFDVFRRWTVAEPSQPPLSRSSCGLF